MGSNLHGQLGSQLPEVVAQLSPLRLLDENDADEVETSIGRFAFLRMSEREKSRRKNKREERTREKSRRKNKREERTREKITGKNKRENQKKELERRKNKREKQRKERID
jgi:hypothetical protein